MIADLIVAKVDFFLDFPIYGSRLKDFHPNPATNILVNCLENLAKSHKADSFKQHKMT